MGAARPFLDCGHRAVEFDLVKKSCAEPDLSLALSQVLRLGQTSP